MAERPGRGEQAAGRRERRAGTTPSSSRMSRSRRRRPGRRWGILALGAVAAVLVLMLTLAISGQDAPDVLLGAALAGTALVVAAAAFVLSRRLGEMGRTQRALLRSQRQRDVRDRARHARMLRAVDRAELRLFVHLEALAWLRDLLALDQPLPPTRPWAVAPDLLLELVRIIDRSRPLSILELGSGVSTIVMAARLKALGQGRLVALEHEPSFAAETRRNLALQGLDAVATVLDTPLEEIRIGETEWRWYSLPEADLPASVGLLLVDGPPGATGPLARYPALPRLASRLAPGATIVLDDADRPDERETTRRWQAEWPGLSAQRLRLQSGVVVLQVPAPSPPEAD